ncbi:MAG: protein kinase [Pseudooceanicola sp.]|nr:protein kinase [Pseudooceanicola sp.]
MADLTPAQLKFLQDHLGYNTKGYFAKKSLKSQVQEFWRRRDKAEAEIKTLPPEHPQLANLQQALANANKKAEGGDLKGAYHDLKTVKQGARSAATAVKGGISVAAINSDLDDLENAVRRLQTEQRRIREMAADGADEVIDEARLLRDPADENTRDGIITLAGENLRRQKELLMEWDAVETNVTQALQTYKAMFSNAPTIPSLLALISHNIQLLNKKNPEAGKGMHNARYTFLDQQVRQDFLAGKGAELQSEMTPILRTHRNTLLDVLKTKTSPPPMEVLAATDDSGNRLEGGEAKKAEQKLLDQFKHLDKVEEQRLEAAKKRYLEALNTDRAVLTMTEDTSPMTSARIRPFDTATMMDDLEIDVTDTRKTPDQIGQAAGKGVSDIMDDLLKNGTVPDEAFEMCTRSDLDWYVEAAKAAGLPFDPKDPNSIDPTVWHKIKAAGDAMKKAARDKYPDKAKVDKDGQLTEFTLGGVTYSDLKLLGQGGGGTVYLAKDANGNKVVVKTPIGFNGNDDTDEAEHQGLRKEAGNHRSVSGGESGDCPENVLDMKGMVLAPNGAPLIVMDLAGSGDAEQFTESVGAAEKSGLISDKARQALMAQQMREIVTGMKAMQSSGMTHHDLKEANVFVDENGVFKVADFGLAQHVDSHEDAIRGLDEFTPGYEPPELQGDEGAVTQKSDNFTLGEILERITDPLRGMGTFKERFSTANPGPSQKTDGDGDVSQMSSLTRLMNKMKDPDPSKRPTLDAVLMSSYFDEVDQDYTAENVERLKKATAAYSKALGKEAGQINTEINRAEGQIRQLELSKSDGLVQMKIHQADLLKGQLESRKRKLERELGREWDDKKKASLQKGIDDKGKSIKDVENKIDTLTKQLGAPKSRVDLEDIDKKIAAERKKVIDLRNRLDALHKEPKFADVVKELEEANAAFA